MTTTTALPIYMVIDVESIGLHGEGFAIGFVVVDANGATLDEGCYACCPQAAIGPHASRQWVSENVPAIEPTYFRPLEVRNAFWTKWDEWRARHAQLVVDCGWPVETRFLSDCIADDPYARDRSGPYPLLDLAGILFASGKDPIATHGRLDSELPVHHPLSDARQSARILIATMEEQTT